MLVRILFFILCFPLFLFGQNLVLNGSFEELRNLPVKDNPKNSFEYEPTSGYLPFQSNLKYWFAGSRTTPDLRIMSRAYHRECRRRYKNCDRARTGDNFVGIITYMGNMETDSYREYIQIKLAKPLQTNKKTFVEFWVAKERLAKLVSNNLGCYFAMNKIYANTLDPIDLKPQINCDTIINEEKKGWVKIEGSFYPDKPFEFLTIGNFFQNEFTKAKKFKNYNGSPYVPPYAYYLIDDVKVWQESPAEEITPLTFDEKVIKVNEPVQLNNIQFEHDSSVLLDTSLVELNKLLMFLKDNPTLKIAIQGHTNDLGTDDYNLNLSQSRAKVVFDFLTEKGIGKNRLSYEGFGELKPFENNDTETGKRKNRRVEFLILEE
jgi:outer membrane protein OmpA-like peptidoglycan-associated protein